MSVELNRRVPCATCGGENDCQIEARYPNGDGCGYFIPCPDCTDGTVRVPVSCATCVNRSDAYGEKFCFEFGTDVDDDFGCLSWAEREGTDGNN